MRLIRLFDNHINELLIDCNIKELMNVLRIKKLNIKVIKYTLPLNLCE